MSVHLQTIRVARELSRVASKGKSVTARAPFALRWGRRAVVIAQAASSGACKAALSISNRSAFITLVHAVTQSVTTLSTTSLDAYTSDSARSSAFALKHRSVRVAVHLSLSVLRQVPTKTSTPRQSTSTPPLTQKD